MCVGLGFVPIARSLNYVNGWVAQIFVIPVNVSVLKSRTRNMLSSIASAGRCVNCAQSTHLFIDVFQPLYVFTGPSNADFIPFLARFQVMTDPEINAFLNQDSCRLFYFCRNWFRFLYAG